MLDAGSGNGYFSWLAYQSGANVVALNVDPGQIGKAQSYFIEHQRADPSRLHFEQRNLYDLSSETRNFDEIICYETLEHIRRDHTVLAQFYRILRPGGVLHLCCPNRMHPRHQAEVLDRTETGGHVRAGYTVDDYRRLLEPIGFDLPQFAGIGSKPVYFVDEVLRKIRGTVGNVAALPFLPFGLLALKLASLNPRLPYSIYVKATKPSLPRELLHLE